ncbi:unannotated protein [freshwater metagenome]|uniref:Unannotated protein n=1 Tax=freshwater metagenome TaxID=449393 RepID=A0A6J7G909_9ZZZZ
MRRDVVENRDLARRRVDFDLDCMGCERKRTRDIVEDRVFGVERNDVIDIGALVGELAVAKILRGSDDFGDSEVAVYRPGPTI